MNSADTADQMMKMTLEGIEVAVSYTHLDVYKRQR